MTLSSVCDSPHLSPNPALPLPPEASSPLCPMEPSSHCGLGPCPVPPAPFHCGHWSLPQVSAPPPPDPENQEAGQCSSSLSKLECQCNGKNSSQQIFLPLVLQGREGWSRKICWLLFLPLHWAVWPQPSWPQSTRLSTSTLGGPKGPALPALEHHAALECGEAGQRGRSPPGPKALGCWAARPLPSRPRCARTPKPGRAAPAPLAPEHQEAGSPGRAGHLQSEKQDGEKGRSVDGPHPGCLGRLSFPCRPWFVFLFW